MQFDSMFTFCPLMGCTYSVGYAVIIRVYSIPKMLFHKALSHITFVPPKQFRSVKTQDLCSCPAVSETRVLATGPLGPLGYVVMQLCKELVLMHQFNLFFCDKYF